jgi:hypothetical protein
VLIEPSAIWLPIVAAFVGRMLVTEAPDTSVGRHVATGDRTHDPNSLGSNSGRGLHALSVTPHGPSTPHTWGE